MIRRYGRSSFIAPALLLVMVLLLVSCGGGDPETTVVEGPPPSDPESQVDSLGGSNDGQEPSDDTSTFEEAELPDDFPANFPIPDDARIASTVGLPGENEFRVFISLTLSLEQALAFYQHELPVNDWTILVEDASSLGTRMEITCSEYTGALLFVAADTGVALDVHLFPLGGDQSIPDLAAGLGDSTSLGDSGSSFPSDLPLPTSFMPIDLSANLKTEGYELAFTYVGMAEMAMVELNIALMTAGWEMGEPTLEGISGVYILPFEEPGSGFAGYAYITSNPGQFNLDTGGAVLIALAQGSP